MDKPIDAQGPRTGTHGDKTRRRPRGYNRGHARGSKSRREPMRFEHSPRFGNFRSSDPMQCDSQMPGTSQYECETISQENQPNQHTDRQESESRRDGAPNQRQNATNSNMRRFRNRGGGRTTTSSIQQYEHDESHTSDQGARENHQRSQRSKLVRSTRQNTCESFTEDQAITVNPQQTSSNHLPRRFMRDRNVPVSKDSRTDTGDSCEVVQSEISESLFKTNAFECMICCDNIHRKNPIWYCTSCYNIFHMKCAVEWCNKSIRSRDEAIANAQFPSLGDSTSLGVASREDRLSQTSRYPDYRQERQKSIEWPCPTCRKILHSRPGKYKCFCGKVIQPEPYRHLTPHSCGQICGRKRPNAECSHPCDSLCHPGRCNPCQLVSTKTCHCGKISKEVKCSTEIGSCDNTCGKTLNCGHHTCSRKCHNGPCSSCDVIRTIRCYCNSKSIDRRCGDVRDLNTGDRFPCDKICDKLLSCGSHRCLERCHPGPECPSCPLANENLRTCPCGSKSIPKSTLEVRKSCTDPIPTCESKCNRPLICGPDKNHHRCQKKCHTGTCPPCRLKSIIKCQCSLSSKSVECSQMFDKILDIDQELVGFKQIKSVFKCETRCNTPKNCGKHRCQEKCCDAIKNVTSRAHTCILVCNRKLPCGTHVCQEICHPGLCGDCTNIGWTELSCHCGSSIMYPPIPCGARPPACHRPCRRQHECDHPVKHECHDDTEKCAPCTVFVKRSCYCGAESKDSVYCYQSGYSCGRTCKRNLSCGQHSCKRVCHDGDCDVPNHRGVIVCLQPCPTLRYGCKHPCNFPCHGKTPCPPSRCTKLIDVSCDCGNRTESIECHKLSRDSDNRNKMAMLSLNRPNQDSVVIDLSRKATNATPNSAGNSLSSSNSSFHKLECDETCAIYKRNKALAEALDIAQPDLKPACIFGEDPLKLLREAVAQDYKFVASTYNSLARLVKSVRESDRRFTFLQFPPAEKLKREVIHELAYHFNCMSESREEEPERYVIVRASKNKSSVPEFTIEQLLPIDD